MPGCTVRRTPVGTARTAPTGAREQVRSALDAIHSCGRLRWGCGGRRAPFAGVTRRRPGPAVARRRFDASARQVARRRASTGRARTACTDGHGRADAAADRRRPPPPRRGTRLSLPRRRDRTAITGPGRWGAGEPVPCFVPCRGIRGCRKLPAPANSSARDGRTHGAPTCPGASRRRLRARSGRPRARRRRERRRRGARRRSPCAPHRPGPSPPSSGPLRRTVHSAPRRLRPHPPSIRPPPAATPATCPAVPRGRPGRAPGGAGEPGPVR